MNLLLISRDFCYTDTCLIKSPGRIEVSAWRGNVQGEIMLGIIYLLLAGMLVLSMSVPVYADKSVVVKVEAPADTTQ